MLPPYKTSTEHFGDSPFEIKIQASRVGTDLNILVTGGTHPHIGAITFGNIQAKTIELQGHKEGDLSHSIWEQIHTLYPQTLLVQVGIHIDDATPKDIELLLKNTQSCLQNWMTKNL